MRQMHRKLLLAFLPLLLICSTPCFILVFELERSAPVADVQRDTKSYTFDAARDTTQLTPAEMSFVRRIHQRVASFDDRGAALRCPDRFLFVNTHTYGRHHNQLQAMMNIILWSARLNRTAVLGWFRVNHKWIPFDALYDATAISRRYCVVSAAQMQKRIAQKRPATLVCYGQCVRDTPLYRALRGAQAVRVSPPVSPYFPLSAMSVVMPRLIARLAIVPATIAVIGGQYGFALRGGLVESAALYSLLGPSAEVRQRVHMFLSEAIGPQNIFFAVHKRHREKMCSGEMRKALAAVRSALSPAAQQAAQAQCNITAGYLEALHGALGMRLFDVPLFVGHDGQDTATVPGLIARGARVYDKEHFAPFKDCHEGLCALAVDYFVLREGKYFTGNVLSSVSQNVCLARLGDGRACHGMHPALMRLATRNVSQDEKILN